MSDEHHGCLVLVQCTAVLVCAAVVISILAQHAGFDTLHTALLSGFGAVLVLCFAPTPEKDE